MKPPVLKREIHARLIRRIAAACLLTAFLAAAAVIFVEYRLLDKALLAYAEKESVAFSAPAAGYLNAMGDESLEELQRRVGAALDRTSFLTVDVLSATGDPLARAVRGGGDFAAEQFTAAGVSVPLGETADGVHLRANKRLYLLAAIPIFDREGENVLGYVRGVYRLSLKDMRALAIRALVTLAASLGGIVLCGFLLYPGMLLLHNHLIRATGDLNRTNTMLLKTLGASLSACDTGDIGHHCRVVIYSVRLAERQGLDRKQIRNLIQGACLHDIGMLAVDRSITRKPGPLEQAEYKQVQQHVGRGVKQVKRYRWLEGAVPVLRGHHEKYDGGGYPGGLAHEKIPITARIFTIADAFDALSSSRPYREALSPEAAVRALEQESGSQFDPVLLAAFLEIAPSLHEVLHGLSREKLSAELDSVTATYLKS